MSSPPANGFHHGNIEELLGGYATGTLTAPEREALFQAALHNQALFDALADEEALRELLLDPEARQRLLNAVGPARRQWRPRLAGWLSRPRSLALAGSVATAMLVVVGVRHQSERPRRTAAVSEGAAAEAARPAAPGAAEAEAARSGQKQAREASEFSAGDRERAGGGSLSATRPAVSLPAGGSKDERAGYTERDSGRSAAAGGAGELQRPTAAAAAGAAGEPARAPAGNAPAATGEPARPPAGNAPAGESAKKQTAPEELGKNSSLRDAGPAPGPVPAARQAASEAVQDEQAAAKLKVAVVGTQTGNEQRQVEQLLARKLDSTGNYRVIDSREVDRVRESRQLQNRPIDAVTAASIGRSVGADMVIVADVETAGAAPARVRAKTARNAGASSGAPPAGYRVGAASPAKEADAQQKAREDKDVRQEPGRIIAQAIDSRTGENVGAARAQNPAALGDSVDQVANQLNAQLNRRQYQIQNLAPPMEGLVTEVNASGTYIDLGTRAGVRPGDRLEVRRNGQVLGTLSITRAEAAFSAGVYAGSVPVRAGDTVLKK